MDRQFVSNKKARSLSLAIFLLGVGLLAIERTWWPDMMIVAGASLAFYHFLLRKFYQMGLTLFIFIGIYFSEKFGSETSYFLPVLLITSAIFILTREYVDAKLLPEDQRDEDLNHEIEEARDNQK